LGFNHIIFLLFSLPVLLDKQEFFTYNISGYKEDLESRFKVAKKQLFDNNIEDDLVMVNQYKNQ